MSDETISKSLGIVPDTPKRTRPKLVSQAPVVVVDATDAERDYKFARENLQTAIAQGSGALDSLVAMAEAAEDPRSFEVLATLVRTLVSANKDLVELSRSQEKKDTPKDIAENTTNVTNNTLFVGSTAELQDALEKMKEENDKSGNKS